MLKLKVGVIEEHKQVLEKGWGHWKFVLSKEDSLISLYAGILPLDNAGYKHADVVSQYKLSEDNILGGGEIRCIIDKLVLDGCSSDFGIVPNSVMFEFAKKIFRDYKDKYSISEVVVDMWYDLEGSERKNPDHVKMWRELGFDFDNEKRIISGLS